MDVLTRIDEMRDEIIQSTQELVQIKSVKAEAEPGKPYGQGIHESMEYTLNLAEKLGFKTKNVDGWAGHAEIGQGDEILGILVHLDVVPEGTNWTYPPYGAEIHDNKLYGRGSIDDKGPTIAAMYAMKAVVDSGFELNKRVRLIFGTDEEIGGPGVEEYYLKQEEVPTIGFSPDAEFPAIHAEKGIMIFNLEKKFGQKCSCCCDGLQIKSIKGGNAANMVPDYAEAVLAGSNLASVQVALAAYLAKEDVQLEWVEADGQVTIKSHGISAHGSLPEMGKNAVSQLMTFLASLDLEACDLCDFVKFYNEKIGMEYYGQSIGCGLEDEVSGKLIFNVGVMDLTDEQVSMTVNVRYPVTSTNQEVMDGLQQALAGTGLEFKDGGQLDPLYVPKDDELVASLMAVYHEMTGDDSDPIAIGGGTYARSIPKAVAFGPLFPGQPELAHQKDEYIDVDDLVLNAKIYAKAILALAL